MPIVKLQYENYNCLCRKNQRKILQGCIGRIHKASEPVLQASETECAIIKDREGERILKSIRDDGYVIALAIDGKTLDSVELSEKIDKLGLSGKSNVYFVIGGSLGLSDAVMKRADYKLSFSRMTFPHQLMRVILLEQIYRSYRIINHEPYHK